MGTVRLIAPGSIQIHKDESLTRAGKTVKSDPYIVNEAIPIGTICGLVHEYIAPADPFLRPL